jgi:hypothetical protein
MAGTGYCDVEDLISERFPDVVSAEGQESIGLLVEAASRFVDSYIKKPFGYFLPSPSTGTARNFRGDGTKILRLPKHIKNTCSITNLNIEDWYESPEGHLYRGESAIGGAIPQGWVFELNFETFDRDIPFWINNRLYVVTARWGYEETPADISEAVMQIVYRWWKTQAGTLGQITPNGFLIERDIPKAAKAILDNYVDEY